MLLARLAESFTEFTAETDSMFYEDDRCVVFVNSASGKRFAMEMTLDSLERVQKICLACDETDKAEEFYSLAEKLTAVYAPDEDFKDASEKLFGKENYSYYESQWYYYAFSKNETGLFFSIENKKLAPEKELELTLKENDIITAPR